MVHTMSSLKCFILVNLLSIKSSLSNVTKWQEYLINNQLVIVENVLFHLKQNHEHYEAGDL